MQQSYFARRLEQNPELTKRCEETAEKIRELCPELLATLKAEQISPLDLATYINTRAEDYRIKSY